MTNLKIFNETNSIYPGVNASQFSQLEYLIELSNSTGQQLPSLGLFGEASTGKTTTAKLIASSCKYNCYILNASSIFSVDELHEMCLNTFGKFETLELDYRNGVKAIKTPKTLIIIDEAHELKNAIQTKFLTILTNQTSAFDETLSPYTFFMENITWIFATTDPSKLLYPLTTRLHPITFDQYTLSDIKEIIKLKYKLFDEDALTIMANCSKLVPRTALRNSEFLKQSIQGTVNKQQAEAFAQNFLGMEPNGIDSIDKRILAYLSNYQRQTKKSDEIFLKNYIQIKQELETKGLSKLSSGEHKEYNKAKFQILLLTEKLNNSEPLPKSRQDISLACRLLDLKDLELRLTYLEKLSYIEKTPKGIVIAKEYRKLNV